MKHFIFASLLVGSASAAITTGLPGNTEHEGWDQLNSSTYTSAAGFPGYPDAGDPWPTAIAANVAGSAQSAEFSKVSGGGYFATSSLYDAGLGGSYRVADSSPLASLATIVLQVDAGTSIGIPPVLNYNGGSQELAPDDFALTEGDYLSGFGGPVAPTLNHVWQWDTRGLDISSYEIIWGSNPDEHLTQYEVSLDTGDLFVQTIPEPSPVLLLSLLPFAACLRRQRPGTK